MNILGHPCPSERVNSSSSTTASTDEVAPSDLNETNVSASCVCHDSPAGLVDANRSQMVFERSAITSGANLAATRHLSCIS
jgi:hypothetical protein